MVTKEWIEKRVKDVDYIRLDGTRITICKIAMVNGFVITGESACVNPDNFDAAQGRKYAYEDAFDKIWKLEGYLLAEQLYRERIE
jgi:hypothetical protein